MSTEKVLRSSGVIAIASGVVLIALALAQIAVRASAEIPDVVLIALRMSANILMVFALIGIYYALSPWSGRLGKAGIVLAVIGLLLIIAGFFTVAGWSLLLLGLLVCAIACTRTGLSTGAGLWLWLTGTSFSFVMAMMGLPVLTALGVIVSGSGRIWLGCAARCEMPALTKASRPEAAAPAT